MKSKTGEYCSNQPAQVGIGDEPRKKIKKMVATSQLMLALIKSVVDVGVVLSLKPF